MCRLKALKLSIPVQLLPKNPFAENEAKIAGGAN
jgi:hypothetical protein